MFDGQSSSSIVLIILQRDRRFLKHQEVNEHSSDCDNESSKLHYDEATATSPLKLNHESECLGQNAVPQDTAKSEGQMQKNVTDFEGKSLRDSMAIMKRGHKMKKLLSHKSPRQQECTQNISLQRESPDGSETQSGRPSPKEISNNSDHPTRRQRRRSFRDKFPCSLNFLDDVQLPPKLESYIYNMNEKR
ncbi:hypothetical protein CHS0354_032753 [Potamilus streckersoni]|uniref:Uncharacterized protein n=1 Tax=Potamilus streckersoni TaxID=2493646 RepID=A0AAE0TJG1_9BIVA|nr:hypothetical protein CHS0354_032753 [Potamilus streckersoni]